LRTYPFGYLSTGKIGTIFEIVRDTFEGRRLGSIHVMRPKIETGKVGGVCKEVYNQDTNAEM